MSEKFITKEEVAGRTAIHPRTLRNMVSLGQFPKPVKISPQRIAFVESEVDAWMADRMTEAGKSPAMKTDFCETDF